jgi:glycosyltransferase involved in cell wall biosynthesis
MSIGGTELNMLRLASRLDPDRFSVVIAYGREGNLLPKFEAAGLRLKQFEFTSLRSPRAIGTVRRLRSWLKSEQIDVLHTHDIYSNVFGALAVSSGDSTRLIMSRRWGIGQYNRLLETGNRLAYTRADLILANSNQVAVSLRNDEGVREDRIVVVHNFVDEAVFAPEMAAKRTEFREAFGVPPDALVVGTIANLRPVKDQATLLRAIAALPAGIPPVHVVLIGEGASRRDLEQLAGQLGIAARVHLIGAILDASKYHHAFDVSVLTSVREGFPNTLVEAMAAGRPVVATRVGGVPDAVIEGETGYMVEAGDHAAFGERLARLLTDPDRRERMGRAGYEIAARHFHEAAVVPMLEGIYRRLLALTNAARATSR